jgi:hypothetical protein
MIEVPGLARLRGHRILIVLQTFQMGGAERQALLLARALRRSQVAVAIARSVRFAGLAVAGTELAATRECIGPETPLAPEGDAATLADHIVRLASDPALRAAEGGRRTAPRLTRPGAEASR